MGPCVVAVPVRDEVGRIGDCLRALVLQQARAADQIVLLLNNCRDGTADAIARLTPTLPVPIKVIMLDLPTAQANAGNARRLAMDYAATMAGPAGVILTTDADSRVAFDWVAANLDALQAGADAVCGRVEVDPLEAASFPALLVSDDANEVAYGLLLDEIAALVDPDPFDPWPRHTDHSGASIAVTVEAYRKAGGVPEMAFGEDRALIGALVKADARIRHASEVRVIVSGRTVGRAEGGMADTIRRRMIQQDEFADDRLEPPDDCHQRIQWRACVRRLWLAQREQPRLASTLNISTKVLRTALRQPYFGLAWSIVERSSPLLIRRTRVRFGELPALIDRAMILRDAAAARTVSGEAGLLSLRTA